MKKIRVNRDVNGIDGLCVIEPTIFTDNRGYLMEAYNATEFCSEGLNYHFIQENEAFSFKSVLRGFHVNINHPQAKLIRVISGEIFDVVIDLRKNSKTYKKVFSICLSGENKKQLYIPDGFAHAYLATKDSVISFKVTANYIPGDEIGFAWNSKGFIIDWPIEVPILNEVDSNSPDFSIINY